jgi:hypothetical protein
LNKSPTTVLLVAATLALALAACSSGNGGSGSPDGAAATGPGSSGGSGSGSGSSGASSSDDAGGSSGASSSDDGPAGVASEPGTEAGADAGDAGTSITSGLAAYWTFDTVTDAGLVTDLVGDASGTVQGPIVTEPGQVGRAIVLSGTSNYVDFGNVLNDVFSGGASFSVSMWLQPTSASIASSEIDLLSKSGDSSCSPTENERQFNINFLNGDPAFSPETPTLSAYFIVEDHSALEANIWQHLLVVYDGSGTAALQRVDLYVNGASATTSLSTSVGSFPFAIGAGTAHLGLGQRVGSNGAPCGAAYEYYAGEVDDVAIWSRALSADEALQVYQRGVAGDGLL